MDPMVIMGHFRRIALRENHGPQKKIGEEMVIKEGDYLPLPANILENLHVRK
jgi:hypothetical protein